LKYSSKTCLLSKYKKFSTPTIFYSWHFEDKIKTFFSDIDMEIYSFFLTTLVIKKYVFIRSFWSKYCQCEIGLTLFKRLRCFWLISFICQLQFFFSVIKMIFSSRFFTMINCAAAHLEVVSATKIGVVNTTWQVWNAKVDNQVNQSKEEPNKETTNRKTRKYVFVSVRPTCLTYI